MVKPNFTEALKHTFDLEGGWSDHANDRGGRTKYGITEGLWKRVRVAGDARDIADITRSDAAEIYEAEFWRPMRCGEMPSHRVAAEMFDAAVNCGAKNATMFAQRAANTLTDGLSFLPLLIEDGRMGPLTAGRLVELARRGYEAGLLGALRGERYIHYRDYADRSPSQRVFIRGWCKRLV
jgi:lysozyme family protein